MSATALAFCFLIVFSNPMMVLSADGSAADGSAADGSAADGKAAAAERNAHAHEPPVVLAPGYADLSFTAPAAGSYRLPPLGAAANGVVLDTDSRQFNLHELMGDRLVVMSFIYTSCSDVNGCPLATHVFGKVADVLKDAEDLKGKVRLISLSFDPDYDTPEVMAAYADHFQRPGVDWQFLTTASLEDLDPLLDDYGQWVLRDFDADGEPLGTMSHLLRVFLIDRELRIRNIYSVSFLHADTIGNDLRTLLLEGSAGPAPGASENSGLPMVRP